MSSCIVVELLMELLNFSNDAYMRKLSENEIKIAHDYTHEKGYVLEIEIFNEVNETYDAVFTIEDQIFVAFKGTRLLENKKTDPTVAMVKIGRFLLTNKDSRHRILSSMDWKNE